MTTMNAKIYNKFISKLEEKKDDADFQKNFKKNMINLYNDVKKEEKVNKPKKALNAYNIFMSKKMKELVIENPDEKVKDRFKRAAAMWNIEKDIGEIAKPKKETKVKKVVEKNIGGIVKPKKEKKVKKVVEEE
tara:strand:- start:473 stop:871 length:399 start_codon:yes stop_codon:yes gene_type:complete